MKGTALVAIVAAMAGCSSDRGGPPPRVPPPSPPYPYAAAYSPAPSPYYASPPAAYPQPVPAYGAPPATPPAPAPVATYSYPAPSPPAAPPAFPAPAAAPSNGARPLLGPLLGSLAWQAEVRSVAKELVANLGPQDQAKVATIPLVFDPHPNEVNAFAGCDDSGAPFVAGTEGLLEAIDGISQTKATDELFGTQTYEAYVRVVAPALVSKDGGSAMLPAGVIPATYWLDLRRISRAHEIFDEIAAFTFGHELSHHYLGHTGCAAGQANSLAPALARLDQYASNVVPLINHPNETAADVAGCIDTLDTGRARAASAYRFTERGGLWLLDFFARLEAASGANPFLGFLRTHPNPGLRIPVVQATAASWRMSHPG